MLLASQETNLVAPVDPCSSHTAGGHIPERQPRPCVRPGLRSSRTHLRPSQWSDLLYLLDHAKPEKGRAWGSSLLEAAFQVGVKAAGCFPGDELGCA